MADERIMYDENLELVDFSEIEGMTELFDDELDEVNGGRMINERSGAFTTKQEAELYAETKFRVGYYYNLKGVRVQCISTGARSNGKCWLATCYYRTKDNKTGYATIGCFR